MGGRPSYSACARCGKNHLGECLLGRKGFLDMVSWVTKSKSARILSKEIGMFVPRHRLLVHQLL